jgi:hypothetical protein
LIYVTQLCEALGTIGDCRAVPLLNDAYRCGFIAAAEAALKKFGLKPEGVPLHLMGFLYRDGDAVCIDLIHSGMGGTTYRVTGNTLPRLRQKAPPKPDYHEKKRLAAAVPLGPARGCKTAFTGTLAAVAGRASWIERERRFGGKTRYDLEVTKILWVKSFNMWVAMKEEYLRRIDEIVEGPLMREAEALEKEKRYHLAAKKFREVLTLIDKLGFGEGAPGLTEVWPSSAVLLERRIRYLESRPQ